jgi:hypothetical protein
MSMPGRKEIEEACDGLSRQARASAAPVPPPDPEAQIEALLIKAKNPDLTPEARHELISQVKKLRPGRPSLLETIKAEAPARR